MKIDERRTSTPLRVNFPFWLRVLFAVGGPIVMLPLSFVLLNIAQNEFTFFGILIGGFCVLIVGSILWAAPIVFSMIYATQSGIQRRGLLGGRQTFSWDEIKTVVRPRFRIPNDAAYIISNNDERMTVARSMSGYTELLRLIQEKAPNVRANPLSEDLWPSKSVNSWRGILIFLVLFIAYIVIRKLTGW